MWTTEGYNSPTLDKPGVGIAFDLGRPRQVIGFHLLTQLPGWQFQVRIGDSLDAINEKLVRRHPHIFGDETASTGDQVLKRWDEIKAGEKH